MLSYLTAVIFFEFSIDWFALYKEQFFDGSRNIHQKCVSVQQHYSLLLIVKVAPTGFIYSRLPNSFIVWSIFLLRAFYLLSFDNHENAPLFLPQ